MGPQSTNLQGRLQERSPQSSHFVVRLSSNIFKGFKRGITGADCDESNEVSTVHCCYSDAEDPPARHHDSGWSRLRQTGATCKKTALMKSTQLFH